MTGPAALGEENEICFEPKRSTRSAPSKYRQVKEAKGMVPEFGRFQFCQDVPMKQARGIGIHVKGESAWFRGLMRCGSVWICPICAPRVAAGRRDELQAAINHAVAEGLGVVLVTLTFPHGAGDVLEDILEKFTKAQRKFKSGSNAAKLRERIGYVGEIKTLEVTHGVNGWHPHAHSLWILKNQPDQQSLEALQAELYQAWLRACLASGLPEPSREHGVDVRGARYAADYIAKWGFAMELAGSTSKRGKLSGRTPWQLLADATEGDHRARILWREFALAFFGKRQLFWSKGLRKRLSVAPELTEQEIMNLEDECSKQILVIDLDTWYCVQKAGAQEAVLHHALHDLPGLFALLNYLRSTVPLEHGRFPGPREDWER